MTYVNLTLTSFISGEVSPKLRSRFDLPLYNKACELIKNFIVEIQGSARFRPGFVHVHNTRLHKLAWLIPFQFNDAQSYLIEATDQHFRFYKDNAVITEATKTVSGITKANPAVVTATGHGYSNGDEVNLADIVGMVELNDRFALVANKTTNTFAITDIYGTNIDSTAYTTYSSGGTAARIYDIATPYVEADIPYLQFAQNADTMYIANKNYAPRKLTRSAHTSWTLGTFSRTADPFTGAGEWPGSVKFYGGRLYYFGSTNKPQTFWGSQGPSAAGAAQYDDFTTGALATNAVIFTMAQNSGQQDLAEWLSGTNKFLIFGTFGGVAQGYGASEDQPITPTAISIKPLSFTGCAAALPFSDNKSVFFIKRGLQALVSVAYDFLSNSYVPYDRTEVAEHLALPGLKQLAYQSGKPEVLWVVRNDGVLLGMTYKEGSIEPGWHRHVIGGLDANVLAVGGMPRPSKDDQIWMVAERTIAGKTFRSVEYMSDEVIFPVSDAFYSDELNGVADNQAYLNALYEAQKDCLHLDMGLTYDGTAYGTNTTATLTPGTGADVINSTGVVFIAGAAVFTATMIGRELWKKYDAEGNGGGRAIITGYTDSTHVTATISVAFDDLTAIDAGNWYLTATTVGGLWHLEGETINVVADGSPSNDAVVSMGTITIESAASKIQVGLKYQGILKTMNLEVGGIGGAAQNKLRNVAKVVIRLLNSLGLKFGTRLYNMEQMEFRETGDMYDRPTPAFSGGKEQYYEDGWTGEKHIYIVQDFPLPCIVQSIDVYTETVNE